MDSSSPISSDAIATEVSFRPFAFANATAIFLLIGATSSLYGPLLISFSHKFHISLPEAGILLSVNFVGAVFGVPLGWLAIKRFTGKTVLCTALLPVAAGATGVALSSSWTLFLICAFIVGFGSGGVDFALNTLMARTALEGRAHRLSLSNAGYGLGAVVGPLFIIALRPHNFPVLFGGVAVAALLLSTMNQGLHAPPLRAEIKQRELSMLKSQRRPILATFILAYILYVAVETSSSGWIASQLHREGHSASIASLVTAGFWGGLTLGRVVGGPLHKRVGDKALVLVGLSLGVVLSLVAFASSLAPYAYPLLGLVIASVYPMGLIWYTVLCPHDSDGLALLILFMMFGGVFGPGVESLMVSAFGIHVVPLVIAAFAALDIAVFASAIRFRPLSAS